MTESAGLTIVTFAKRPDLLDKVFEPEIQSGVPEFMRHDPTSALYYRDGRLDRYREFGLVAVDPAQPDRPVARAFSVPFALRDGTSGHEELPDSGWDAVIRWADDPAAIAAMQRKVPQSVGACFELIEHDMLKGPWVMGEAYTVCDPYLFTLAGWLEGDGVDLTKLPRVMDHHRRMSERPAVQRAVAAELA